MVSRTLVVAGFTVCAAVLVTAAPRAISNRHNPYDYNAAKAIATSVHDDTPAESCADLHMRFSDHASVMRTEEKTITSAEAGTLRVKDETNGGVQVQGWNNDKYSVTLCKAAEQGNEAEDLLAQVHMNFSNGELSVSGPAGRGQWAAHLLIKAPRGASMDVRANNGPLGLFHVEGNLKVRAVNGPIAVHGCKGELDLSAENGPVSLRENGGRQKVITNNGPMTIDLDGKNWSGSGLEAHATNGPVSLLVPEGYQSGVVLESDGNGPFSCRASVCGEGRKNWDEGKKSVEFGSGPTVVHVSTVNGPVTVR